VEFSGGFIVCSGGGGFIGKVAEVVGFFVGGNLCGPFFLSLVPVDSFVLRGFFGGGADVPAVLGEGAGAEILFSVVQALMVDVVDYEVVGGVCYLSVHFDAFSILFANGIVILLCAFSEPGVLGESGVVIGIDDSEPAAGKRYQSRGFIFRSGRACRVEIRAFVE